MRRLAIFADAGYLYAEGSRCAFGRRRERRHLRIVPEAVISALKEIGRQAVPEAYLLRIYWYDGLIAGRPSAEQSAIAALPDVKMRFGYVNSAGQQKGVDTRIVTDLVELARNQAITDAILVSGDEDLRVGVEIAQSFGIRVHLLGIQPAAGSASGDMASGTERDLWERGHGGRNVAATRIGPEGFEGAGRECRRGDRA